MEVTGEVISILKRVCSQLEAMNCSPAHAVSWVEPRSDATTNMVLILNELLSRIDEKEQKGNK